MKCPHKKKRCYLWNRMQKPKNLGLALCNYLRTGICIRERRFCRSIFHYLLGILSPTLPVIIGKDESNGKDCSARVWGTRSLNGTVEITDIEIKDKDDETWRPF